MTSFVQGLQNNLLTSWMWCPWQHEETGRICTLLLFKSPGRRWYKCKNRNAKEIHQTAGDEEVVKMECRKCHKSKELSRLTIARDKMGAIQLMCVECQTGSKEMEDLHVKVESAIFDSADEV
jgi:hypothetical protein